MIGKDGKPVCPTCGQIGCHVTRMIRESQHKQEREEKVKANG
jgi:uncharacterized Zn finger protein (UPF0148 family)